MQAWKDSSLPSSSFAAKFPPPGADGRFVRPPREEGTSLPPCARRTASRVRTDGGTRETPPHARAKLPRAKGDPTQRQVSLVTYAHQPREPMHATPAPPRVLLTALQRRELLQPIAKQLRRVQKFREKIRLRAWKRARMLFLVKSRLAFSFSGKISRSRHDVDEWARLLAPGVSRRVFVGQVDECDLAFSAPAWL